LRKGAKEDIWLKGEEITRGWICLIIDSIWKSHLDHLMNKTSWAHYTIRIFKPYVLQESLSDLLFLFSLPHLAIIYLGCRKE
jgi:hypothetical protein